jgi:hypothetical protein
MNFAHIVIYKSKMQYFLNDLHFKSVLPKTLKSSKFYLYLQSFWWFLRAKKIEEV